MPSIKQNQLGGWALPGTLLSQSPDKFRDMLNMQQDPDGVYTTRNGDGLYNFSAISGNFTVRKVLPYVGDSGDSAVLICNSTDSTVANTGTNEAFIFDLETGRYGTRNSFSSYLGTYKFSFTELNDVLYFIPQDNPIAGLHKYDGVKWSRAGLPRCAVEPQTAPGTTYSRHVYMSIDFKGNETIGDYTQLTNTPSSGNVIYDFTQVGGAVPSPAPQDKQYLDQGFDDCFIRATSNPSYNAVAKELTVPSTDSNLFPGQWMQFIPGSGLTRFLTNFSVSQGVGYNVGYMFAFRVKRTPGGTSYVFDVDPNNAYVYVDRERWITAAEWNTTGSSLSLFWESWTNIMIDLNTPTKLSQFTYASNTWVATFTSASASSGYILRDLRPVAYLAASYNVSISTSGSYGYVVQPFNSIPAGTNVRLEDVFDDTVVRSCFPLDCKYLATDGNSLIASSDTVTYFSSPAFGSSIEVIDGFTNFVPGTNKDGLIVGLGATENFIFISREKRNYSVVGNLATGNFEVRPYRETQPGVSSWENIIAVQDNVFFANKFGIFAATPSSLIPVSKDIVGAFYKTTTQRQSINGDALGPLILKESSYDYTRNWISWRYTIDETDMLLILDLNNGQYYRWKWAACTCQFISGKYYATNPLANTIMYVEDFASTMSFGTSIDSWLTTSWISLDEPSLEKQFTQVKLFLRDPNFIGSINVSAYQDWQPTTAIQINAPFIIDPAFPLSQKHKFVSNKSLAISLVFSNLPGEKIEIEGYELEYNPIQEGMKR